MTVYIWSGKNRQDKKQKGEMEAPTEEAVRAELIRRKITPSKIKKKPKDIFENVSFMQPKVKEKDIIIFCRQFSTMIDAGLPIIQCLDILFAQHENKTFKNMLKEIKQNVESGQTFAEALKKYPKQFDDLFVNMVSAGEAGGILDTILRRLSAYMEKAARLKSQVKGAMTYPIVTLIIAVLVVAAACAADNPIPNPSFETLDDNGWATDWGRYNWGAKESQGTQKLDREVRGLFWRMMPRLSRARITTSTQLSRLSDPVLTRISGFTGSS